MPKKQYNLLCLMLFFLTFSPSSVWAQMIGESVNAASFVFPPFIYLDDKGQIAGDLAKSVTDIFDEAELTARIDLMPWNRAYQLTLNGTKQVIFPLFYTEERAKQFLFTQRPIFQFKMTLFRLTGSPFSFDGNLDALRGKIVSRIRGVSTSEEFDRRVKAGEFVIVEANNISQQIKMLLGKRVDLAIGSYRSFMEELKVMGAEKNILAVEPVVGVQKAYIATSQKSKIGLKVIARLNAAQQRLCERQKKQGGC